MKTFEEISNINDIIIDKISTIEKQIEQKIPLIFGKELRLNFTNYYFRIHLVILDTSIFLK